MDIKKEIKSQDIIHDELTKAVEKIQKKLNRIIKFRQLIQGNKIILTMEIF